MSAEAARQALEAVHQIIDRHGRVAFHAEEWHLDFLRRGTLPDISKGYPLCY